MMVIYKLLSEVNKHCDLKTPKLVDKDVVEGTNFTPFFLDDKCGKVYMMDKAIARLPDRVFTIDGMKNLHGTHFNNLRAQAHARIIQEDNDKLVL